MFPINQTNKKNLHTFSTNQRSNFVTTNYKNA